MLTTDHFTVNCTVSSAVGFAVNQRGSQYCSQYCSQWLLFIKGVSYGPPDPIQNAFALEPPVG